MTPNKPRPRSLKRALIGWLAIALLAVGVGAAIATYRKAREEANALFDYQLQQMAASLTGMPVSAGGPSGSPPGAGTLVVQVWDRNGVQVYVSQPQSRLPQHAQLGFKTVSTDAGEWRVFSILAADQVVQVAQPMSVRRALAASMAMRTIVPLVIVLPLLAILAWFTIARGLRPLERIAVALRTRSPRELAPLPESEAPAEVTPLVHALNDLLGRLDHAISSQRTFIADAAHELRTPLTAVHLQAQVARRAISEDERNAAFVELTAGLERATHLVEQLLTLAREEPEVASQPRAQVDLVDIARTVVAEQASLAAARGLDLGLATAADARCMVRGDASALRTLLSNLVDNAVRHTPRGGRIDVGVTPGTYSTTLEVRDSGPGILPTEYPRVFDRFYRAPGTAAPGSGLGLAIVKRIAERHGATVELGPGLAREPASPEAPDARGLSVRVDFPGEPIPLAKAPEHPH